MGKKKNLLCKIKIKNAAELKIWQEYERSFFNNQSDQSLVRISLRAKTTRAELMQHETDFETFLWLFGHRIHSF